MPRRVAHSRARPEGVGSGKIVARPIPTMPLLAAAASSGAPDELDDGKSTVARGVRTLAVAPGTYDLTVAFPGCAPQTRRLVLRAGERTSEAFELAAERK